MPVNEALEEAAYKKRILVVLAAFGVIALTVCVALSMTAARADSGVLGTLTSIFLTDGTTEAWETFCNPHRVIYAALTSSIFENTIFSESSPAGAVTSVISGLALLSVVIAGFIHMLQMLQRDEGSLEGWCRLFVTQITSVIAVVLSDEIVKVASSLGQLVVSKCNSLIEGSVESFSAQIAEQDKSVDTISKVIEALTGSSFSSAIFESAAEGEGNFITKFIETASTKFNLGNALEYLLTGGMSSQLKAGSAIVSLFAKDNLNIYSKLIVYIALAFIMYSMVTACYALLFEMALRRAFFPLGVASICSEGMRSPGIRYVKQYFGLYIRMISYMVIGGMATIVDNYIMTDASAAAEAASVHLYLGTFGAIMCVGFATKACMKAASDISRDVLGV